MSIRFHSAATSLAVPLLVLLLVGIVACVTLLPPDPDGARDPATATGAEVGSDSGPASGASESKSESERLGCGPRAPWDSDGDGLSDLLERNNLSEGYHPFDLADCDSDPSRPLGTWYDGSIRGAVNLTDRGAGYRHNRGDDPVDGDDWGALSLVGCIEEVGRLWEPTGIEINVNDLSLRSGSHFSPHRSHQNGLDADLRYVRRDGRSLPLDLRRDPDDYDPVATRELLSLFAERCDIEAIFVDLDSLGFDTLSAEGSGEVLVHQPGHSNHFHLRVAPPTGES